MSSASEDADVARRKAAAQRRREEHYEWKREFFQARPPPPPIGRLHRRQCGRTKGHSCHALFTSALELHRALCASSTKAEAMPTATTTATTPGGVLASSTTAADEAVVLTKQAAWAAQLREEQARRNPATDLNIRTDPTRTVIMANLHPDTVDEDLRHFADQFGRVVQLRIVRHIKTGKSRRYAFVEFGLAGEARRALQSHRKKRLKGHAIIIDREKGRTEPNFLPARLATAAAVAPQLQERDNAAPSAAAVVGMAGGSAAPVVAAAPPAMPENDDDFLNSILNS